jgi:hypothetical protein
VVAVTECGLYGQREGMLWAKHSLSATYAVAGICLVSNAVDCDTVIFVVVAVNDV